MNGYGKQTVKHGARNISIGIGWIVVAHSALIFAVSVLTTVVGLILLSTETVQ
jgi:hypothetical protein